MTFLGCPICSDMEPFTKLKQRASEPWLFGIDQATLVDLTEQRLNQLIPHTTQKLPTVLLAETDPIRFLAGLIAACTANCPVFLGNPHWAEAEWQKVLELAQPDVIFSDQATPLKLIQNSTLSPQPPSCPEPGWLMIPTGGSSGQIRFAIHTWETLTAAVQGVQDFFGVDRIHACCVLPLYHVSGFMQFLRSFLTGGTLAVLPFRTLTTQLSCAEIEEVQLKHGRKSSTRIDQSIPGGQIPIDWEGRGVFLSLVPTQLQRLLQNSMAIDWLQQFQTIFLGGAPAWTELLTLARSHQLPLAPTYGMTETAAQVVTLKPEQFLQGINNCGQVLPHVTLKIFDGAGLPLQAGQIGTIAVRAKSLMLGYFPNAGYPEEFLTDDLGYFDAQGMLQVVGRNSQKIITGGENVFPTEVEAAIRATGLVSDVCIVGMPDQTWGEAVIAFYVPDSPEVTISTLQAALVPQLSSFKHPKQWIAVESLLRNAQGKINLEYLKQTL